MSEGHDATSFSRVIKRATFESMLRADEIIAAAETDAVEIRRRAEAAYAAEKERGFKEGLQQVQSERADQAVQFVEACAEFLGRCEVQVAEVAFECLEASLGRFDDAERIRRLVRQVVEENLDQQPVRLRVHPDERF